MLATLRLPANQQRPTRNAPTFRRGCVRPAETRGVSHRNQHRQAALINTVPASARPDAHKRHKEEILLALRSATGHVPVHTIQDEIAAQKATLNRLRPRRSTLLSLDPGRGQVPHQPTSFTWKIEETTPNITSKFFRPKLGPRDLVSIQPGNKRRRPIRFAYVANELRNVAIGSNINWTLECKQTLSSSGLQRTDAYTSIA